MRRGILMEDKRIQLAEDSLLLEVTLGRVKEGSEKMKKVLDKAVAETLKKIKGKGITPIKDFGELSNEEKKRVSKKFSDSKLVFMVNFAETTGPQRNYVFVRVHGVVTVIKIKSLARAYDKSSSRGYMPSLSTTKIICRDDESGKLKFVNIHWRTRS
jgi:hypothetical protein